MDPLKIRRNIRLAAVALILCIGNITRIQSADFRMVEALSYIALGMSLGVLMVNFFLYRKIKNNI